MYKARGGNFLLSLQVEQARSTSKFVRSALGKPKERREFVWFRGRAEALGFKSRVRMDYDGAGGMQESGGLMADKVRAVELNHERIRTELEKRHQEKMVALRERLERLEQEKMIKELVRTATSGGVGGTDDTGKPLPAALLSASLRETEDTLVNVCSDAEQASQETMQVVHANTEDQRKVEQSLNDTRLGLEASQNTVKQAQIAVEKAYGPIAALDRARSDLPVDENTIRKKMIFNLRDVDAAIASHPAISNAMSFSREDDKFANEIFCAVIPKKGARASEPWLKLHAQTMLPAMMIPKRFFFVERLPTNRKELSATPDVVKAFGTHARAVPTSPVVHPPAWEYKAP
uniref:AMP-binding enzyme C-terminal domain-containing protein n=1 Tax=Compsopogon caeruleus TaxID=31354 RepID=A0A7S1XFR3_9RHOD|mmetsp:Transcript_3810/g.7269  ORF Transcript_3810/g.7269 Transcript_3810/m.7269 type:complete len:347 (+) Transcript_3810:292-1332(+)